MIVITPSELYAFDGEQNQIRVMASRWLDFFPKKPEATIRLLCFHHWGGNSRLCARWFQHLPSNVEVVGIVLPGHGRRRQEPYQFEIHSIVAEFVSDCWDFFKEKSFVLFGTSMGGLFAYEVAQELARRSGPKPLHFCACSSLGPSVYQDLEWGISFETASNDDIIKYLRTMGGTSEELLAEPKMMDFLLPSIRADGRLLQTYVHKSEPIPCPVTVFCGTQDKLAPVEKQERWQAVGEVDFVKIDAGHFFFQTSQIKDVLQRVAAACC